MEEETIVDHIAVKFSGIIRRNPIPTTLRFDFQPETHPFSDVFRKCVEAGYDPVVISNFLVSVTFHWESILFVPHSELERLVRTFVDAYYILHHHHELDKKQKLCLKCYGTNFSFIFHAVEDEEYEECLEKQKAAMMLVFNFMVKHNRSLASQEDHYWVLWKTLTLSALDISIDMLLKLIPEGICAKDEATNTILIVDEGYKEKVKSNIYASEDIIGSSDEEEEEEKRKNKGNKQQKVMNLNA
jgi:hypothetical protein